MPVLIGMDVLFGGGWTVHEGTGELMPLSAKVGGAHIKI